MARIRQVEIENFRSIRRLAFEPGTLCALVGANNAGKSNILAAINLVIGPRWPTEGSFTENDCYQMDKKAPMRIRVDVEAVNDHGRTLQISLGFGQDEDGAYKLSHRLGAGPWSPHTKREYREACPLIRLGIDRSIRQQQATNRWTLLGRLLLEINDQLRRSPEKMREFEETMERLRTEILGSVPAFEQLASVIRRESARQLQRSEDDIYVRLDLHDPWNFYRTLQIVIRECGATFRAEQMGMGMQSSLAIALLRAYAMIAKEGRAVIAIEEPELFLHPLAQRQFYRLLREMAEPEEGEPIQILYATHSGNLLDLEHFDDVCIVRKIVVDDEWTTTVKQGSYTQLLRTLEEWGVEGATADSIRARLKATFDPSRTAGLFADAVLLVEGPTEELALPIYAQTVGIDLDALNIAVVSAGGKTTIPTLLNVFQQLEIPCYVLFDGDAHQAEDHAKAIDVARACSVTIPDPPADLIGETATVWERDFEYTLRREIADYDEIVAAARAELGKVGKPVAARYCALRLSERGEVPPSVRAVLERVLALRQAAIAENPDQPEQGFADYLPAADPDIVPLADDDIPF